MYRVYYNTVCATGRLCMERAGFEEGKVRSLLGVRVYVVGHLLFLGHGGGCFGSHE